MTAAKHRTIAITLVLVVTSGIIRAALAADHPALLPQDGKEAWVFIGLNQAGKDWYLDVTRIVPLPDGTLAFTLKRDDGNHGSKVLYIVDCASGGRRSSLRL